MSGSVRLQFGALAEASDGPAGELGRVIIDPASQELTHLVVTPRHGPGRLIPVEILTGDGEPLRLRCTRAELRSYDEAEEATVTGESGASSPYSFDESEGARSGLGGMGSQDTGLFRPAHRHRNPSSEADRVPLGKVEIRHDDPVHALDGPIGAVGAVVIDPGDHHVTHVLLKEGHLWHRKQVAIPIGAANRVGDEIQVKLTRQQVADLPSVELTSAL